MFTGPDVVTPPVTTAPGKRATAKATGMDESTGITSTTVKATGAVTTKVRKPSSGNGAAARPPFFVFCRRRAILLK
jgi:hypothetical protein